MNVGIWLPVFGGWLRNISDEGMPATFPYVNAVAQCADELGFSTILVAELNLNDIKGPDEDSLEAWTTLSALAATTRRIRLMAALRPGFRLPAIAAKMAANIDHISGGRFEINLVSAWWKEEMEMYCGQWLDHTSRYRRSSEFVKIMQGLWEERRFDFSGDFYTVKNCALAPKPLQGRIPIYAGGESQEGRQFVASHCDHYLMHGESVEAIGDSISDMRNLRRQEGRPEMQFGMAAYFICRDTEKEAREELERITTVQESAVSQHSYKDFVANSQLRTSVSLKDYSVSNRGLRPDFVGTPVQIAEKIQNYKKVGLDLILMQCSPMLEETARIGKDVLPLLR